MRIVLSISLLFFSFFSFAQFSLIDWGVATSGYYEPRTKNIVVDNQNNILSLGIFSGTIDLDPGNGTFTITNNIGNGSYLQMLDSNGIFLWGKYLGAIYARAIDLDVQGNIYITGNFGGTQDFDPGTAVYNLTANSATADVFIVKLDPLGNFLWAKNIGIGSNINYGQTIKADQFGNVYVAGRFIYMIDLDPGASSYTLTSMGAGDGFLLKMDASGNFLWGQHIGGGGTDEASLLEIDPLSGSIYCVVRFDMGMALPVSVVSAGADDFCVLKFDSVGGSLLGSYHIGGTQDDICSSLFVDGTGNLYLTGSFRNTVDFDPGVGVYNLTAVGNDDIFVLKLSSSGQFLWAKQMGGTSSEIGGAVAYTGNSTVYIGGNFSGTVDFDPGIGVYNLTANSNGDAFLVKLDANGNFQWAQSYGNGGNAEISDIVLNTSGSQFLCKGSFTGIVDFDAGVGVYNLTAIGYSTFIIKQKECTPDSSFSNQTACRNYVWNGISYSTSGTVSYSIARAGKCDSVTVLHLTINQPPTNAVTQKGDTLVASATNAIFQWVDCNNNFSFLPGATDSIYIPNKAGSYAVIVTDILTSCSDTSNCYNISITSTKDFVVNEDDISIYPNPTSGKTAILFSKIQPDCTLEVVNATGKMILKNNFENIQKLTFSLASHPAGLYFVSVFFNGKKHFYKLLKQE